ncbi:uncharacterized protein EI97DRAFT_118571 [Westerdykella ornata]|uniref:Uncharacterized protein n=1 Tax=Westerdykella ornata TaxID=318751 RepID=A0A6A6JVR2_WESOR|nr:uncharacterized protein EI97DRAFT_118571 [Westerdykella ornata]KAF2280314.1 hypothetical protein EI97DRAFT_118571 [Westerdykella ornata]
MLYGVLHSTAPPPYPIIARITSPCANPSPRTSSNPTRPHHGIAIRRRPTIRVAVWPLGSFRAHVSMKGVQGRGEGMGGWLVMHLMAWLMRLFIFLRFQTREALSAISIATSAAYATQRYCVLCTE